jgi:AraC-like DNA-binding protein
MDIKYNVQELQSTLQDVYQLIKTPISVFDRNFQFITSYPDKGVMTRYCTLVRQTATGAEQCRRSDEDGGVQCRRENCQLSYLCHANLFETVTPIRFENMIIGYILFGQYRFENMTDSGYPKDSELQKAYLETTVLKKEQVEATCHILEACILRFWFRDAITLKTDDETERIRTFIDENLDQPLTAEDLCRTFLVNKQKLYRIFRQNFNVTVKEYVLSRKISKAKKLLKNTELSVTEISERTGFSDYNIFIQRFKRETGFSPLKYRKNEG